MDSLSLWFEKLFSGNSRVVTVIGSGGKTSLIWHLAASLAADRKILVTPTTKMFVPSDPVRGVTLAGVFNQASGKLESLPLLQLEEAVSHYDLVLIEGDGGRLHPLKAWTDDEPVVPPFTDVTVGILPVNALGREISEDLVHRLPIFLALTGAKQGERLKPEHLIRLITGGSAVNGGPFLPGLFAKAQGKKILFFNQAEDDAAIGQAHELADHLPSEFRGDISGIIAGSVRRNSLVPLS